MTAGELASKIDHSLLKPKPPAVEGQKAAAEAMEYGFASVCVAPAWVAKVAIMARAARLPVCTVIGFPHGANKSTIKAIEATSSIKEGADEIDVVAFLPHLLRADVDAARAELIEIVKAA